MQEAMRSFKRASQEREDLSRATGAADTHEDFISNLSRISQLTGFSDPIYAEAYVKVHGFDILLGRKVSIILASMSDAFYRRSSG